MERVTAQPRQRDTASVQPRNIDSVTARPKQRPSAGARPIDTLWERNGWTEQAGPRGRVYTGQYRARDERTGQQRVCTGRIEITGSQSTAWIEHPPRELLREHPKRACFVHARDGWYRMNWWRGTSNIDETIGYVEQLLTESINRSWPR